jgi:hypothetical protein
MSVYLYGNPGMAEAIELYDTQTGAELDSQIFPDALGQYLTWAVRGKVTIKANRLIGVAMLNGIFFDPIPAPEFYDQWVNREFSIPEQQLPSLFAGDSDPDRDGISNFQEYVFGTDPKQPTSTWKISVNNSVPAFAIRHNSNAKDFAYFIEASTDLLNWTPPENLGISVTSGNSGSGYQTDSYQIPESLGAGSVFFRVSILTE